MLVIVSTPLASCPQCSCIRQHFIRLPGPQTGLGNLLITQGTFTITSIGWIYLSKLNQSISYSQGCFTFQSCSSFTLDLQWFQQLGSFSRSSFCMKFEWLNLWHALFTVYSAHINPWSCVPLSRSQTSWYVQSIELARYLHSHLNLFRHVDCMLLSQLAYIKR